MKPRAFSRGTALRVFWVDSSQTAGWKYDENIPVMVEKIATLGWVTDTSSDGINMTSTLSKHGGVLSYISIPWKAIVHIQELNEWDRDANLPL
jgi:hypothetical protein